MAFRFHRVPAAWLCGLLCAGLLGTALPAEAQLPEFLPGYYEPAFTLEKKALRFVAKQDKDELARRVYGADDQSIQLAVERVACDTVRCQTLFENARGYVNEQAKQHSGRFRAADGAQFVVEWRQGLVRRTVLGFRMPNSVVFWTYGVKIGVEPDMNVLAASLRIMANRQRYDEARAMDNIKMGNWGKEIHEYARALLQERRKADAAAVLTDLLATSPANYAAHMDLAAVTSDPAVARNSARTVLNGTEDPELSAKAARIMGQQLPSPETIPALESNESGLQLILIPLPPCDVQLVIDAGKVYEKITGIPVKVRRLATPWRLGRPDRVPEQRRMQQAILQQRKTNVNFAGWTLERYRDELIASHANSDPLSRFFVQDFADKLETRPAQYLVDPYLQRFVDLIAEVRSTDVRTMYVGVTEANIYAGDANFVFSSFAAPNGHGGSILSYSMMLAKTLSEPFESRTRLVERLAKEMVPASLKSLNIPRATDPTDPYSYSDGVERLAQKTLELSPPTKQAIDRFR